MKYFESSENHVETIQFTDRNKIIVERLITDYLNKEELKALSDLCYEFSVILFAKGDKIVGNS